MLNTNQLAKATNLAAQTIYTYVKDGTITPTQVGPNGGYFFSEDIVCELLLRQAAPKMKNSILTIKFAKDTEDFEKFEEAFDEAIAKTSSIRVDDISAYIKHLQERTQVDYMYNRVFLALFAVTAIKECESKTEKLQTQVQAELFQYGNIEDFNSAIACLNNKIHGIKDDNITLSEKDERAC